jgi:hypothetical protein
MDGYIETKGIYYPNKEDLFESRNRLLIEEKAYLGEWLTVYLSGSIDGLLSNRDQNKNDLILNINDIYTNFYFSWIEIKIGYTKVFWGKLEYSSPTDIVNPLNISELFLTAERREAKLPVFLTSVSFYFGETSSLNFLCVPIFREGKYDHLNEQSSPFNIINFPLTVERASPPVRFENIEYGLQFSNTFQSIDWSLYYYKHFQDFPSYRLEQSLPPTKIEAHYPRCDMFGYDFEFVLDKWGIRNEGALLVHQGYQLKNATDYTMGNSFITGFGFDRISGVNYLNLCVLYSKKFVKDKIEEEEEEIALIGNLERTFSYETKKASLLSIYNIKSGSVFLNGILSLNIVENFWVDLSVGIFNGEKNDIIGGYNDTDFFLIKCKYSY